MNLKIATAALVLLAVGLLFAGMLGFGIAPGGSGGEKPREASTSASRSVAAEPAAGADGAMPTAGDALQGEEIAAGVSMQLAGGKTPREQEAYINGLARSFASLDPLAALEKVRQLPDAASREMAMLALLGEWSGMTSADIVRNGDAARFGIAGALGLYLMNSGRISPAQAASLANEYLAGDQRTGVLGRAAAALAATDPAAAMALGDGLTGQQQVRFLARFAMGWAGTQPEAARQWASQISDPRLRSRVMERILEAEVSDDPAQAARSFAEAPPESPEARARAATRIAETWAGKDTVAAMQWAAGLTDPASQAAARQGIDRAAPVGIGAMLNSGSDGIPVVGGLVSGSSAGTSGSMKVGDRIIAVSKPDGSWVDSRSIPMREVTSLIRGEPNTQVSLQVQSPGDASLRVINLNRQQIIHRPE